MSHRQILSSALSIFTVMAIGFLSGCQASKSSLKTLSEQKLQPVTAPTIYRYGPCVGTLNYDLKIQAGSETQTMSFPIHYSGTPLDENLMAWHLFMDKLIDNHKTLDPRMPLVDIVLETDLRGLPIAVEATFPALDAMGESDVTPKQQKALEKLKHDVISKVAPLPEKGIISGQKLMAANLSSSQSFSIDRDDIYMTLAGEFSHEDTAYVVATIDETIQITEDSSDMIIFMDVSGYAIFSRKNMETVEGELTLEVHDPMNTLHAKAKIRMKKAS